MKTLLKLLAAVAVLAGAVMLVCRLLPARAAPEYIPLEME